MALDKVQVALEEDWLKSMEMLEGIEASAKTCKSPYEQTQVWKFKGFVYYSLDDFPEAIRSYKQVITGEGTPEDLRLDTRYTLAKLFSAEERYAEAAAELEIFIEESIIISNDARILLAQIYYQFDRKEDSLTMLESAIDDIESKGKLPKESWWSLQRVLYHEKNDYNRVVKVLENLVKHYPTIEYKNQLLKIRLLLSEQSFNDDIPINAVSMDTPKIDVNPSIGNSGFNRDSDYIPVYVPQPQYPRRAQARGKEGYAVIQVIITTEGGVRDPVLIEEFPEGWGFGRSAVKVAKKLKYNIRKVNGVPKELPGVLYKFTFNMAK
jgi:TonB family protein